jgi:hypothetical protein
MCRSIKQLRGADYTPSAAEIEAAALQYVRKISGYRVPSRTNRVVFDTAVAQITQATTQLLAELAPAKETPTQQEAT